MPHPRRVTAAFLCFGILSTAFSCGDPGGSDDSGGKGDRSLKGNYNDCVVFGDNSVCIAGEKVPKARDKIREGKPVFRADAEYDWSVDDKPEFSWQLDRKLTAAEVGKMQSIGEGISTPNGKQAQRELRKFLHSIGAQPTLEGETGVKLELMGTTSDKVVITDFEAMLDPASCHDSSAVTFITLATAGGVKVGRLDFDLDEEPSVAQLMSESGESVKYAAERHEELSTKDSPSPFVVRSHTQRKQVCDWVIAAKFKTPEDEGVQIIDNGKKPFTIGYANKAADVWYYDLDRHLKPGGGKPFARRNVR